MKSEKLTSFALVIAAVALLIVGAMSYRDYLKAKYEKEFGGPAAEQTEGSTTAPGRSPRANAVEALPSAKPAPEPADAGQIPPIPPGAVAVSAAADPKLNQYKENLDALRRENTLYREKLEQSRNGGGAIPPMPNLERAPSVPSSAVAAATGSPAAPGAAPVTGSPELPPVPAPPPPPPSPEIVQKEVSAMAERVRKEASIAKVVEYNPEWAFMVLDGGRDRGIEAEMRFAVRRGSEILGWVKITEVEPNRSVAHLMSENKNSKVARKPAKGDDIIAFNLF